MGIESYSKNIEKPLKIFSKVLNVAIVSVIVASYVVGTMKNIVGKYLAGIY